MKKVRFETPTKIGMNMHEYECQSPRPFLERQIVNIGSNVNKYKPVIFSTDPVHRFENDNSLPYPIANKTCLSVVRELENKSVPSSDLDLSILDCSKPNDRILPLNGNVYRKEPITMLPVSSTDNTSQRVATHKILTSVENKTPGLNQLNSKDNEFFLKRQDLENISFNPMHQQLDQFNINNQYNPVSKKSALIKIGTHRLSDKENYAPAKVDFNNDCNCHHCTKIVSHSPHNVIHNNNRDIMHLHRHPPRINYNTNGCVTSTNCSCNCNMPIVQPVCNCCNPHPLLSPENATDKKTWAIEKYEKTRGTESSQIEKSNNVIKEKREPTVSDLFKIIKMQNEQLQLLQEKVDKFISTHNNELHEKQKPIQNYMTEQLAVQTVNSEQHKISIGVMTSFEMVRTSTVINKEIVKQCEAQIQCNRSQISIKEVVSKKQPGNLNFLDGISPVSTAKDQIKEGNAQPCLNLNNNESCHADNIIEDKTLNELSLYNVQVDNATTPLMSPEQSLYLDIRDYSESDSGSDDQSNVGWTYYNKVMTHVNGMLQDSDMPSSASALYRQTKQKFMQIDKSNVSVAKRVTFGDDPLGVQQHHISNPTDTSLKMDQLAAKYLKHARASHTPSPKATGEMSFATRKYMERHNLLQGQKAPLSQDIPRFLDITALKQQPKFI